MKIPLISMQRWFTTAFVGMLMVLAFLAGHITGYGSRSAQAAEGPSEFAVFWEAWDVVVANFVDRDKIDFAQMTYGAISGMLSTLGDEGHTTFLSPEAVKMEQSRLEGAFEGIGAYVAMEEGEIKIVAPIGGSPAEVAGILPGDVILAVDGNSVQGLSLNQVINQIRGPANTEVTLKVRHPDSVESTEITIVRQRIVIDSVTWSLLPDSDIAYVKVTQFANETGAELERALQEIVNTRVDGQSVSGLILDLRNNPGGYLREAIRVGSQFLPRDATILIESDANKNMSVHQSRGWYGYGRNIPIVVLINQGTASAGEITAGAIKENGRGILVGQTTFGTGTVLSQFNLSDGSAIRLGVTNWLTPDGNLIKGQGIEPNISVEQPADTELLDADKLKRLSFQELLNTTDMQFLQAWELLDGPLPVMEAASTSN
ncbi:MAG: S41 family peptidase [Caldilineaceae bacterium]|nr:S41 family peptidase [Caldilineaceae bacterium]